MKKHAEIIALIFAFVLMTIITLMIGHVSAAAPTMFTVDGSTSFERQRLERIEHSLNFTKVPMPDTWNIHIISKEQFDENIRRWKVSTISAYTLIPLDQTYINEYYLTFAPDSMVRQTLAHEAGHMICNCASESKANEIAWVLQQ